MPYQITITLMYIYIYIYILYLLFTLICLNTYCCTVIQFKVNLPKHFKPYCNLQMDLQDCCTTEHCDRLVCVLEQYRYLNLLDTLDLPYLPSSTMRDPEKELYFLFVAQPVTLSYIFGIRISHKSTLQCTGAMNTLVTKYHCNNILLFPLPLNYLQPNVHHHLCSLISLQIIICNNSSKIALSAVPIDGAIEHFTPAEP